MPGGAPAQCAACGPIYRWGGGTGRTHGYGHDGAGQRIVAGTALGSYLAGQLAETRARRRRSWSPWPRLLHCLSWAGSPRWFCGAASTLHPETRLALNTAGPCGRRRAIRAREIKP